MCIKLSLHHSNKAYMMVLDDHLFVEYLYDLEILATVAL